MSSPKFIMYFGKKLYRPEFDPENEIYIYVKEENNDPIKFSIKKISPLRRLRNAFWGLKDCDRKFELEMLYNGQVVSFDETPLSLQMKTDDIIEVRRVE